MKKKAKKLRQYSAADVFLWLLLLMCVAGIGIRIAAGERSIFTKEAPGEYLISVSTAIISVREWSIT